MRMDFATCLLSSVAGRGSKPGPLPLLPRANDAGPPRALSTPRSIIAGSRALERAGVESLTESVREGTEQRPRCINGRTVRTVNAGYTLQTSTG